MEYEGGDEPSYKQQKYKQQKNLEEKCQKNRMLKR